MILLDAETIAYRLHRPWSTVRWWAHKGWLTPRGKNPEGRIVYDLAQAKELDMRHTGHGRQLDKQP